LISEVKSFANKEGKQVWFAYPRWTRDQSAIMYQAGGALYNRAADAKRCRLFRVTEG